MTSRRIPVVDLFAGPGGLGEGFSSVRGKGGNRIFDMRISIEKDQIAHQTLTLRALYRALSDSHVPDSYYDYIRGNINREQFFAIPAIASALQHARREAQCLELGVHNDRSDAFIRKAVDGHTDWVLIGGPPCQAYSVAGRARRRNEDLKKFEADPKHFLYREYLRIIRDFQPSVFVMENVKGMLSSKHGGERIFDRIMKDLSEPARGVHYDIRSFVVASRPGGLEPEDFLIRSENYGIPQMRHRVILFGVRADRATRTHDLLTCRKMKVSLSDALAGLPSIRSRLSKEPDSHERWINVLQAAGNSLSGWRSPARKSIEGLMAEAIVHAQRNTEFGNSFQPKGMRLSRQLPADLATWLHDPLLGGVCQHQARGHMRSDIHRYLFASCFAKEFGFAPKLASFPNGLLPNHKNVGSDPTPFDDRFRVQIDHSPSTTVVSHIAKDGHYYIHPDPTQCRSLTVREAARLQTFPDNYFFEGNRTQQYHQVGNAVPPFLARQLGEVVAKFMCK